ncbi:MAG TPA: SRPBCC family protein [Solirubrobacterales bacterium]
MAKDVKDAGDVIGAALGTIAREVSHSVSRNGHSKVPFSNGGDNGFSGARGLAAGAVLASAAPLAGKAAKKLVMKRVAGSSAEKGSGLVEKLTEGAKDTVGKGVKDAVGETAEKAGGAPGLVKEAGKKMLPGGGEDSKGKGAPGVGKGRRMPVQQAVDIGVPLSTAYNQWTQFEEWPQFMHRLDQATQEDDCTISFKTKVWGMSKEFVGQIVEQRPDERIQWSVKEGVIHTGVVTFHELAPRLTRVQVTLDVEPGSLIEKAARGMRHVKRAVRADLARFKAYIEMQEVETGAWRGVIHDGELAEGHDEKYDKGREYAEFEDIHDREHSHAPQSQEQKKQTSSSRRSGSSSSGGQRRGSGSRSKASSSARSSSGSASGRSRSTKKRSRSGSSRKRSTSRS